MPRQKKTSTSRFQLVSFPPSQPLETSAHPKLLTIRGAVVKHTTHPYLSTDLCLSTKNGLLLLHHPRGAPLPPEHNDMRHRTHPNTEYHRPCCAARLHSSTTPLASLRATGLRLPPPARGPASHVTAGSASPAWSSTMCRSRAASRRS